jgi:hypothetical protein
MATVTLHGAKPVEVKVSGIKKLLQKFKIIEKQVEKGFSEDLFNIGKLILSDAQTLCPVSQDKPRYYSGFLRDTGFLVGNNGMVYSNDNAQGGEGATKAMDEAIAEVNADTVNDRFKIGFSAWYATIVHERLDLVHPVGEALFLLKAYQQNQGWLQNFGNTKRALKGSIKQ